MFDSVLFSLPLKKYTTILFKIRDIDKTTVQNEFIFNDFYEKEVINRKIFKSINCSRIKIGVIINEIQGKITFNFSIPKFLYETNYFQYIENIDTLRDVNSDVLFTNLYMFFDVHFRLFIYKNFLIEYDIRDIIIERMDLAYNLHFEKENEMNIYFNRIKNISYRKTNEAKKLSFDTSIYYSGVYKTHKIYKKNDELDKNSKALLNINNIESYVLRFEIEFKKKYINYCLNKSNLSAFDESSINTYNRKKARGEKTNKYENEMYSIAMKKLNYNNNAGLDQIYSFLPFAIKDFFDYLKKYQKDEVNVLKSKHLKYIELLRLNNNKIPSLKPFMSKAQYYRIKKVLENYLSMKIKKKEFNFDFDKKYENLKKELSENCNLIIFE